MTQGSVRLVCELVAKGPHETGFADTWFAGEQDDLALALLRLLPAVQQKGEFLVAPDQRRRRRSMLGIEPALGRPLADDVPRPHRFRKTLEVDRTEIAVDEGFSQQAPRRLAITTLPGSASPCSRAAKFGVSPTTARSRASPSPIRSPTTTRPVAMPTRAANGCATARL